MQNSANPHIIQAQHHTSSKQAQQGTSSNRVSEEGGCLMQHGTSLNRVPHKKDTSCNMAPHKKDTSCNRAPHVTGHPLNRAPHATGNIA
eukprot:365494-Chlamydomonas_euryale.AAC.4